jgi:hypothetical protein
MENDHPVWASLCVATMERLRCGDVFLAGPRMSQALARVVAMLREARASSVQRHRPLPTVSLSNVEAIGGSRRLHVGV